MREAKLEKLKRRAKTDYYFFCKEILGYSEMEMEPHAELCDFLTKAKGKRKKLINLPRGAFKSSVVTIGYILFCLVNDANLRFLIASETFGQSKVFLQGIKNHIEQGKLFRLLFGNLKPTNLDVSWRSDEITLGTRTKAGIREASVTAAGMGVTKVGMHYDIIIVDDLVSNKNVNTPEQIQKTLEYYRLLLSILDPGAMLILIGTRYSYGDLYGHIIETEKENYDVLVNKAIQDDGSLYFPTRLTHEFLKEQKMAQGSYIWNCQYQNSPVDEENAMFKEKWLQFYETPPKALRHYLLIDPAASLETQADFTGIVVAGIDCNGNILVVEAKQYKFTIYELIDLVFELVTKYNIHSEGCVGLETVAFQKTLKYMLIQEMDKRNIFFAINEMAANTRVSKKLRIRGLQPYFENGKVFLKKFQTTLIDQILRYPRTKYDDIIDALANVLEVMVPADPVKEDKWAGSTLSHGDKRVWDLHEKSLKSRSVRRTRRRI